MVLEKKPLETFGSYSPELKKIMKKFKFNVWTCVYNLRGDGRRPQILATALFNLPVMEVKSFPKIPEFQNVERVIL